MINLNEISFKEFCDQHDKESWNGLSTAFRNGVKAAVTGDKCNYLIRADMADAWMRGNKVGKKAIDDGVMIFLGVREMRLKIRQLIRRNEELEKENILLRSTLKSMTGCTLE